MRFRLAAALGAIALGPVTAHAIDDPSFSDTIHQLAREAQAYSPQRVLSGCATDFRLDRNGGPLEDVPIRDQSTVPNCYAHASAVMMDAWGLSHSPPLGYANRSHRSSPYWGTVRASSGDRIDQNLEFLKRHGTCDQTALLSENERGNLDGLLAYQIRFNQEWPRLKASWDLAHSLQADGANAIARMMYCEIKHSLFPHASDVTLGVLADSIRKSSVDGMIEELFAHACEGHIETPRFPKPVRVFHDQATDSVAADINDYFNEHQENPQPVGIGLCAEAIMKDDYAGFSRGADMNRFIGSGACHVHAVVVIGRRWNEDRQSCEFLLRNSWGTSCEHYSRRHVECDGGEAWVSGDLLDKSVLDTITIGQ